MKRALGYTVFGLLAYVIFVMITFPATHAFALLNKQVPGLRAANLSGSAWSGQAAVIQVDGVTLERLGWQLKPWSVLFGQLEVHLTLNDSDIEGTGDVALSSDGAVVLSQTVLSITGGELASLAGMPVDLGGQFQVQLERARLVDNRLRSAEGRVLWQRAAVTAPINQNLGEFSAELSNTDDGVSAQVKDEGGPLQLEGIALLRPDGSYSFNGNINVRDRQQKLLVQGVAALGRPGPDGRVPLNYNGRL